MYTVRCHENSAQSDLFAWYGIRSAEHIYTCQFGRHSDVCVCNVHGYFFCFSHCSYVQYLWGYKCVARYGTSNECCLRLWVSVFIVWHLTACLITVSIRKVFHLLHIRIRWIGWAIFLYFLFMSFFRLYSYVHIYLLSAHIFWSL